MTIVRSAVILGLVMFSGCSGCNDDTTKTPDAFIIHDMGIDARACGTLSPSPGTLDFGEFNPMGFILWQGELTGDLGDGLRLVYQYEFYDNVEPSLAGTFDLHAGNQSNYSTCAVCVRAFALDSNDEVVKQYFQSAGSITLTEDPFTNKHMIASITGLQLEEVTVAQQTFVSTPVPGGKCGNFAMFNVDHDRVPNAWTCAKPEYDNGMNCNCMCGLNDPDCSMAAAPVAGCSVAMPACFNDTCVTPPANDTCATAIPLTIGTAVMGSTAGAGRNYNQGLEGATCTDFQQPGPDVVYSVALTANQAITVTLSNLAADYDGSIALVGPGAATICDANPITTCVAGKDAGFDGTNETFMYTATTAGTYFIIVDSYSPAVGGTFTLNVTSP
jgi:hypothetical protein